MGKCLFMRKGETHTAPSAGILASDLAVGSSVYLMENGSAVEYLVVNQGIPSGSSLYDSSCDGTWLLRKYIYTTMAWDGNDNDYEKSDVHAYLNGTFLDVLNVDIQSAIKQIKIPYHKGLGSNGSISSGGSGLSTKIFLLSTGEVGWTTDPNAGIPVDSVCLDYFVGIGVSGSKRIAYTGDGSVCSWWLRSPYTMNSTNVLFVNTTGNCQARSYTNDYGVRPALILPHNALFDKNTLILKGVA